MLALEDVTLAQGDFELAAALSVPDGMVSVIGPSGGGKSTLLGAIAGFVPCRKGQILWNGQDITKTTPSERPVSMVFQDNNLFPHLTIEQNIALGRSPKLKVAPDIAVEVRAVLERVGLAGMGARKPGNLSGGQQSRAALARVLLMDRPIVLLDEPFSALGPGLRNEMLGLVAEVLTGKVVMMVTHDPQDAKTLGGQTVLVHEGRALPPQDTGDVFANPPDALREYLGE